MRVELVISAYQANLDWLKPIQDVAVQSKGTLRVIVYDKSNGILSRWFGSDRKGIRLPNVGKLDHTFCHHIVENYDNLADWTVFVPDNLPLKLKPGQGIEGVLTPGDSVKVPHLFLIKEWGLDGKLQWDRWANRPDLNGTNWTERYYSGRISHARLSFAEWSKRYVGFDPLTEDWPGYVSGAIFGVPKSAITYLPRGFYERLREQLSHSVEPEEGHYLERLWLVIFTGKARYLDLPVEETFHGERKQTTQTV